MSETDQQAAPLEDLWSPRNPVRASDVHSAYSGWYCLALAAAIFLCDRMTPASIPVGGLFVVVLYLTMRLPGLGYFWIGVFGCTGLILLDLVFSIPSSDLPILVMGSGISLFILWSVAWFLWMY